MIYLYRFELLTYDAAFATTERNPIVGERSLVLATSYEAPIPFGNAPNGPLAPVALPNLATAGGQSGWIFQPTEIEHSPLRLDGERESGEVDITLPLSHPIAQLYAFDTPREEVWLTIATLDSPTDTTPSVEWFGKVSNCKYDEYRASVKCVHISEVLNRPGLVRKHTRTCNHVLFDTASCGVRRHRVGIVVDRNYWLYRRDCLIAAISADRLTLTLSDFSAAAGVQSGWFNGGTLIVEPSYSNTPHLPWSSAAGGVDQLAQTPAGGIARSIASQNEADGAITLVAPIPSLVAVGQRATLYAGCDKLQETCKAKFDNARNFGGYKLIPIKNPFTDGVL
jgi:hypothetical protein